jgi:hypothetical protein
VLQRTYWATSLLRFGERCALVLYAAGFVVGCMLIFISQRGPLSNLLYSLAYQVSQSVGNVIYPALALAILRWHDKAFATPG